ncbi:MAG: hypothetical protein NVS1B2_23350 [Vulcanimicrobiaceae bacterium]
MHRPQKVGDATPLRLIEAEERVSKFDESGRVRHRTYVRCKRPVSCRFGVTLWFECANAVRRKPALQMIDVLATKRVE